MMSDNLDRHSRGLVVYEAGDAEYSGKIMAGGISSHSQGQAPIDGFEVVTVGRDNGEGDGVTQS
jgi:hypothetical protein